MHESVMRYVTEQARQVDVGDRGLDVLDVGSLDVNGSVRDVFIGARVVGIDIREGAGVDRVMSAGAIPDYFTSRSFDVVTCCEMLEHDATPWLTLAGIAHVLRPGALTILTARGVSSEHCPITDRPHAFGRHGEPDDWWRYMEGTLPMLCRLVDLRVLDETEDPQAPGWFCTAAKPWA